MNSKVDRTLCIAPMMDWTDRHCRYFLRLISKHTLLYTEMITTGAIIHGDRNRLLSYHPTEHPVALQLGGSDSKALALCAKIGEDLGYDEINLNVGCPSDRVKTGRFGACLMAEPTLVAQCVAAMQETVDIPVTVKTRLGIDDQDSYEFLIEFIQRVADAGCKTIILHARKALLTGISPKENREIPPLRYPVVYRVKQDLPGLEIILNGGVTQLEQAREHLAKVDGVMIGRAAYQQPYLLAEADQHLFGSGYPVISREAIVQRFCAYARAQVFAGVHLKHLTRHILGLFHKQAGAKHWRRHLSENAHLPGAGVEVIEDAMTLVTRYAAVA